MAGGVERPVEGTLLTAKTEAVVKIEVALNFITWVPLAGERPEKEQLARDVHRLAPNWGMLMRAQWQEGGL